MMSVIQDRRQIKNTDTLQN